MRTTKEVKANLDFLNPFTEVGQHDTLMALQVELLIDIRSLLYRRDFQDQPFEAALESDEVILGHEGA